MRDMHNTLSELDFEQLPPTLRRKYFSSLERLRLAQDGSCSIYPPRFPREHQRPLTSSNASFHSTRRLSRRPSTLLDDHFSTPSLSIRNRLRKQSRLACITSEQVAHFASLPRVLQRKYFSREEQILLASRINHVIFDAADEVLYKQYEQKFQPSTTYEEFSSHSAELFDSDSEDMELSQDDLNSLRWLDEDEDLDLTLYDYHAALTQTAHKSQTLDRVHPHRRGLLVSNIPFPRRSSSINSAAGFGTCSSPSTSVAPSLNLPNRSYRSIQPPSIAGHRKNRTSTSSLDPAASHYQDPAARMKLRVYLASPQKFDEAIEFGFPSMQDTTMLRTARPATSPRSAESSPHVSNNDDTPSLSEGDDQETEIMDSPRTPEMAAFSNAFLKSKETSLDRTSFKPKIIRDFTDPYIHGLASNREMTLHMTLTRPDLRSPDELLTSREINSQPLEQAPLHFSDDVDDFWDSLPDSESKVKKLFRKLKLRQ